MFQLVALASAAPRGAHRRRHLLLSGRPGLTAAEGLLTEGTLPPAAAPARAYRVGMSDASSAEGERVLGPPQGTYDADWVAALARQQDPGLPTETALLLAQESFGHLRAMGELDAPELARRLMADHDTTGATAANMVATAAVEFCRSHGVQL